MSQEESKPQTESAGTEQAKVQWIVPEGGVPEVYADWYHVNWMPYTVRIRFAQVVADPRKPPDAASWAVDERIALTMPWNTAKALSEMLTRIVNAYEKTNGQIVIPDIPSL